MELETFKVNTRHAQGKRSAHSLRRQGFVPAVLYGGEGNPVTLQMKTGAFEHLLHSGWGQHAIVQLEIEDEPELNTPALLKNVQYHPVKDEILHADFLRIRLDQRISTLVPVELQGEAEGVLEGGVLDHQLRELEIECLALDVPESVKIDISELKVGDSIHVSAIAPPPNTTVVTDPERAVVAILAPQVIPVEEEVEGEEAALEGEEPAEPEVIGEKKEEEEEEEQS